VLVQRKNVTITMNDDVARWVRVQAAEASTSVSRWVGELLRKQMRLDRQYEAARERFFAVQPRPLRDDASDPYPKREELYDRAVLRRRSSDD
jgi:hypothetical protein